MPEVEIGLDPVFGDETSPCWNGIHGPGSTLMPGSSFKR